MTYDPILKEAHRVKDAISAKYGHDVRRLVRALQESQKKSGAKCVSFAGEQETDAVSQGSTGEKKKAATVKPKSSAKRAKKGRSAA